MPAAQQHRLQIATRMHHLLLRELGQGIDIEQMLKRERYARDVLLVCDACCGTELADLSRQFRAATAELPELTATVAAPGRQARPMDWSRNTSGFGPDPLDMVAVPQDPPTVRPVMRATRQAAPAPAPRRWWQRLMPR